MCVSWRNVSHTHPPFHGLRNPIHTVHVQMIFFTPLHGVQTPFPPNFFRLPNHLFSLSRCSYICIPHKMFLHFRERLENVFYIKCFYILCSVSNVAMVSLLTLLYVLRSFHKMFLHFRERLQNVFTFYARSPMSPWSHG